MNKFFKTIFILSIGIVSCIKVCSQIVPKEDYVSTKTVAGTLLHNSDGSMIKGGAYLYYNDSCIVLHIDGASKESMIFLIYKKYWDKEDHHIVITGFNLKSLVKYADIKELKDKIPDLVIKINYNAGSTTYIGHTESITKKYVYVECIFYKSDLIVSFGSDGKSEAKFVPIIRSKYEKNIKEIEAWSGLATKN